MRVPEPYEHSDDAPVTIIKFVRGSNNSTKATVRLLHYRGDVRRLPGNLCLQLEDREGGGEIWLDADDLADLATDLTDALVEVLEFETREGGNGDLSGPTGR